MSDEKGSCSLLLVDNAYFLAKFVDGEIVSLDGGHSSPAGVAKALAIYEAIGLHNPNATYKMLKVSDVPKNKAKINKAAAQACKEILSSRKAVKARA